MYLEHVRVKVPTCIYAGELKLILLFYEILIKISKPLLNKAHCKKYKLKSRFQF